LPLEGCVFVSVRDQDKAALIEPCRRLVEMGFSLIATRGTAATLTKADLPVKPVNKVREGRPHVVDRMLSGAVQLVFNTTEGSQAIADSFSLRRTALTMGIPYYTTVAGARAAVQAIAALGAGSLEVAPLQSYF
jgi:carbamoyl-phosphate synthase large subunit